MVARLGNVIYWLSLIIGIPAGLLFALECYSGYVGNAPEHGEMALKLGVLCVGSFLIGRTARYVLAGR